MNIRWAAALLAAFSAVAFAQAPPPTGPFLIGIVNGQLTQITLGPGVTLSNGVLQVAPIPGQDATVSIGTVTTGAPGTPAALANSGTASNAILNFTIPAGAAGMNGTNGTNGVNGHTIWSGHGSPNSNIPNPAQPGITIGAIGDFYLDVDAKSFYGPKTSNFWSAGFGLIGPAGKNGVNGANGTNGTNGSPGVNGSTGPQGPAGDPASIPPYFSLRNENSGDCLDVIWTANTSWGQADGTGIQQWPCSHMPNQVFTLIPETAGIVPMLPQPTPPPVPLPVPTPTPTPGPIVNTPAVKPLAQIGGCATFPNDSVLATPIDQLPVSAASSIHLAPLAGNGAIWWVTIANAGTGYQVNDVLQIVQTGAQGGSAIVRAIDGNGAITSLGYGGQYASGMGYTIANGVPVTGGHGTGAAVNITGLMPVTSLSIEPSFSPTVLTITPAYHAEKAYYGNGTGNLPTLVWPFRNRESGWNAAKSDGADHHMTAVVVDQNGGNCQFSETYNELLDPAHSTASCRDGSPGCNTTSFLQYTSNGYAIKGGTDAAGLPLNLILRTQEIKDNAINHPIRITLTPMQLQGSTAPLWPAASQNNGLQFGAAGLPYGARLRLRASFDVSKFPAYAQNILNAFKRQGLIVSDRGDPAITTDMDVHSDPAVLAALSSLAGAVHGTDLEEVDESCLMLSVASYQINPANTCLAGSPLANGPSTPAVAIGLAYPQESAISSAVSYTYNFALDAWVVGSPNQAITWTLASGPGSITSAGVYTVPTVPAPTDVVLTATWTGNHAITANQYLKLWPSSADGNFRTSVGQPGRGSASLKDGSGNTWWGRAGIAHAGIFAAGIAGNGVTALAGNPEANVYYTANAVYGGDYHFHFIAAPGNYKVRYLTGNVNNGCGAGNWYQTYAATGSRGPLTIGVNGQIDSLAWDWYGVSQANGGCPSAFDYYSPAAATSGALDIWYGPNTPETYKGNQVGPTLAAVEIIPDSTSPHIAIDTGLESWSPSGSVTTAPRVIHAGATYKFTSVGWYMTASATWAVTSGPGSIDQNGLYTAPASVAAPANVTISATSTSDSTKTGVATLTVQ